MELLTLAHLKWFRCIVIFFALSNAQSILSASDLKYCYGDNYTETLGNLFIRCAESTIDVTITACDPEYQDELEFGIANNLYETCSDPLCVYYSYELAFRWNTTLSCYAVKNNTGYEEQCWESEYNTFYATGHLVFVLESICFETAIPTQLPSSAPSVFPTQWCDGVEYNDTIESEFLSCATLITDLNVEACDQDYQDDLYFGIANELYLRCENPKCVYATLYLSFVWEDSMECYATTYVDDTNVQCWSGRDSFYYTYGSLEEKLELICFDTVTPTLTPTASPSSPPTEDPTRSPTNAPTTYPSPSPTRHPTPYPTETPTMFPTLIPTMVPSQTPTQMPTWSPSVNPTTTPSNTPTIATNTPTNTPTTFPTENPTSTPTMPSVERTSDDSSFYVSAEVTCITKLQIADTVTALGRVVNVTGQEIGIDSYYNFSMIMTGLEVEGFWIRWLVVLPDRDDELVEMIDAGNITDDLTQEFATDFNISSCSMIIENLTAESLMDASPLETDDYVLWPLICGMIIFVLYFLFVILCFTRKSNQESDSKTPDGPQDISAGSVQVGTTAGATTVTGGAGSSKSKSVSFTGVVPAKQGTAGNNGEKLDGSNDEIPIKIRGSDVDTLHVTKTGGVML